MVAEWRFKLRIQPHRHRVTQIMQIRRNPTVWQGVLTVEGCFQEWECKSPLKCMCTFLCIVCIFENFLKMPCVFFQDFFFLSESQKLIISCLFPTKNGFMILYDYRRHVKVKRICCVFVVIFTPLPPSLAETTHFKPMKNSFYGQSLGIGRASGICSSS